MALIDKAMKSLGYVKDSQPVKKVVGDPTKTKGAPGAVIVDGFLENNETNPALADITKYETYSNLLANISIVAAGVRYFLNMVSKAKWKVRPSDPEDDESKELADLVNSQLHRMDRSWARVVRRAAMYRFYGFSIQEWTMELDDNQFQYIDVAPRPQSTIEQWHTNAQSGRVEAVTQRNPTTGDEIDLDRMRIIYIVDDSIDDTPEGLGLFRHIIEASTRLQRYEQLEGYGFESDLRGVPIGRAPFAALAEQVEQGTITQDEMDAATAPIISFITNHIKNPALGILVDSITYLGEDDTATPSTVKQWDVDLLKGSSTSLPDMAKAIERVNREIARILGVEGLLLGEQSTGSHALSNDKSLNFSLIVDSTLSELADTFQRDFVERFFDVNGLDKKKMPKFDTEALQHRDITQITQALKDMAKAGAMMDPNDPATNEVRAMLSLPPQPKVPDEELAARRAKLLGSDGGSSHGDDEENKED